MLQIQGISHWYGDRQVLDGVTFDIKPGRLTGFVGANGAGKTTTMRAILGLIHPTEGVTLLNGKPVTDQDRARFGYMPEERGLYPKMKVREQIIYFARLHGVEKAEAGRRTDELLEVVGLSERKDDLLESLSLGNQQRAQICVSLVHNPEFLILDEPFSGLDPVAVDAVLGVLREVADRGVPVLFSSHQLDVVERLSDDLVIIADGKIRATGTREELQRHHSRGLYRIGAQQLGWLEGMTDVELVASENGEQVIRIQLDPTLDDDAAEAAGAKRAQDVLREALAHGEVSVFQRELTPLVQIFREVR
ncbi:ABC transporter ATP-binding protein [Gulosibacter bifidus]|uniref:ABC transporter ATP-binding protein n=1 Tax=Gulosibacter bifidus TaxID=272239 RepID=A0ABW5RJY4_9MICO|nr:ATP-binding cassette domain-containing protein [Gulosibacter bifidus]